MGKNVKVKVLKNNGKVSMLDMTIGNVYEAYLPDIGERDKDGLLVQWKDEVWVKSDDIGDSVVTRISKNFEVIE